MEKSNAVLAFEDVVGEVGAFLRARGYRKHGFAFSRYYDGNRAVIAFQRSVSNTADRVKFTLNIGIISGRVTALYDKTPEQFRVCARTKCRAKAIP